LFPTFHDKTMFKAAVEYTVGQMSARLTENKNESVDRMIVTENSSPKHTLDQSS